MNFSVYVSSNKQYFTSVVYSSYYCSIRVVHNFLSVHIRMGVGLVRLVRVLSTCCVFVLLSRSFGIFFCENRCVRSLPCRITFGDSSVLNSCLPK